MEAVEHAHVSQSEERDHIQIVGVLGVTEAFVGAASSAMSSTDGTHGNRAGPPGAPNYLSGLTLWTALLQPPRSDRRMGRHLT